jgi:hypothetical protein
MVVVVSVVYEQNYATPVFLTPWLNYPYIPPSPFNTAAMCDAVFTHFSYTKSRNRVET